MKKSKTSAEKGALFKVGDKVRVRDLPYMFYTRSQMYTRGAVGTIAALTYKDLIAEEEAFNFDGRVEQYYIVRFRQKDLGRGTRSTTIHYRLSALIDGSNLQPTDQPEASK